MNEAPNRMDTLLSSAPFPGIWKAFSLLELLITMAVLAILIALVLPLGTRMLDEARETQCASNMKQLHHLFGSYAADFDNCLPPSIDQTPEDGRRGTWNQELQRVGMLAKSTANAPCWKVSPVVICPAMKERDGKDNLGTEVGYAMNNLLGPNSRNSRKKEGIARFSEAVSPSKTYLFFDGIYKPGGNEWSGIAYSSGNNIEMKPLHAGATHVKVLFLDGHVESRAADSIKWLATGDTDEAQTIAWRGAPQ